MVIKRPINTSKTQPYIDNYKAYLAKGWLPIVIKPKSKMPHGVGVTGGKNPFPTNKRSANAKKWAETAPLGANIAVRLTPCVVGIDVDDYPDGSNGKAKTGGTRLAELEKQLGELPETHVSTARGDGVSGIRYFTVPSGLQWGGKAGDGIDIVSMNYRYSVCWPSYHPKVNDIYKWYEPGQPLDGNPRPVTLGKWTKETIRLNGPGRAGTDGVGVANSINGYRTKFVRQDLGPDDGIPWVSSFPDMPDEWVQFLTGGKKEVNRPIDNTLDRDGLEKWAKKTFNDGPMCSMVEKAVERQIKVMEDDAASHDKILNGDWNIIHLGIEGHCGAYEASRLWEKAWTDNVMGSRDKRGRTTALSEIYRSRMGALKSAKGAVDKKLKEGVDLISGSCACFRAGDTPNETAQGAPVPSSRAQDPAEYALTDYGNGLHLADLYRDTLAYVPARDGWMLWDGSLWNVDRDGLARRCYYNVRDRQEQYAKQLWAAVNGLKGVESDADIDAAKAKAREWQKHARSSGMVRGVENAIKSAQSLPGVTVLAEKLDADDRLLGVKNGVIELSAKGKVVFRQARHDDYITINTNVDWLPLKEQIGKRTSKGPNWNIDMAHGVELWAEYLDRFIPDVELRLFIQRALGYCLLGVNSERIAIFLYGGTSTGKSTMLNAVSAALGEHAESVDFNIFREKASGTNAALAQAITKRVITSSEVGTNNFAHADVFKRMTGNDPMNAERKYSNDIVVRVPAFTPLIATNIPPTVKGADAALKKRMLVLPFNEQIADGEDEKYANTELAKHGKMAILAWLVEGWEMYAEKGLRQEDWPVSVVSSTDEFSDNLSDLSRFKADALKAVKYVEFKDGDGRTARRGYVTKTDMFEAYGRWCDSEAIKEHERLNRIAFGKEMAQFGYGKKQIWLKIDGKGTNSGCYLGCELVHGDFVTVPGGTKLRAVKATDND